MRPDVAAVTHALESACPDCAVSEEAWGVLCIVSAEKADAALAALASSGYEMLVDLFASDTGEGLEITYHLRSHGGDTELYARVAVGYDGEVPSVWETHPAALYAEREAAELFGLSFPGHPNPKRLLTSDDVPGYLMRKAVPVRTHEEVVRRG